MTSQAPILVIDDDQSIRWVLTEALKEDGFVVKAANDADMARDMLSQQRFSVVLSDIRMPGDDGLVLLDELQHSQPNLPVIIMTAHSDLESAVGAYESGAFDYLPKPFDVDQAVELVRRAAQTNPQDDSQSDLISQPTTDTPIIIGEAPAMQEVFRAIGKLARSNISVLINGASGTGKELVARALHQHSRRASGPFVALNMAAIPKDLVESELFGHEKGAFTGANQRYLGRFEQAHQGTLFLDEIGDMPLESQTRLLRVLSEGSFYRVGGSQPVTSDVRIVTATHQDLSDRVAQGLFREDLYHRINVIKIELPALNQRASDIPLLARHFLNQAAAELDSEPKQLSQQAADAMMQYPWPGNVRELQNRCRWLTVMAAGQTIGLQDLPDELKAGSQNAPDASANGHSSLLNNWTQQMAQQVSQQFEQGDAQALQQAQQEFEQSLIQLALQINHGHKQHAAQLLGWGRNTIARKIKKLPST